MIDHNHTRRTFLKTAIVTVSGALSSHPRVASASAATPARTLGPRAFKERLAGPILSLPTTFNPDSSVNYQAVHNMIGRALRHGVPIFGLTAGNSKYASLSYDEIKDMTRAMVEATGDRGMTIAATGPWSTEKVVDYARFCATVGAGALQVLLPKGVEDEAALFQHFKTIARSTQLPIVLHGRYSSSLLRKLATVESIVAMKEDAQLSYYVDRAIEFGNRFAIFSGGGEYRFLVGYPYGSRAFFATYTGFAPDKPMEFWKAIRDTNVRRAAEITKEYDYPFIRRFSHPFWHATLEYFGVARRHMRPPFKTYTDQQMREVKAFFDGQGIDPEDYRTS